MGLKNCPSCGKLMLETPSGVCPECYAQEEQDELKVVEFLREAKKSSVEEIHQATGVKYKVIMRMIKEKRVLGGCEVSYPCESCGTPIDGGRVCANCTKGLQDQIANIQKDRDRRESAQPRMAYIKDQRK